MLHTALGHSTNLSPERAIHDIIRRCQDQMQGRTAQAGILFTSMLDIDYSPLLSTIHEAFPGIQLIGCTTDGESSSSLAFAYDSIALMLFSSDSLRFSSGLGLGLADHLERAVSCAHEQAMQGLDHAPCLSIVLVDGLASLGLHLDDCFRSILGQNHPIFGGKAGDRFRLKRTWQFHGQDAVSDAVVMLHISGPLLSSSAVLSGLNPIGERMSVTQRSGNVLSHINGIPALEFYRRYIGDSMEVITQFPLAVFEQGVERFFLRPPCYIHEEDNSILFNGTFPKGEFTVQLTEMNRDSLLDAAHQANIKALESFPGRAPQAGLMFSCCSRRAHLGTRTRDESRQLLALDGFQHLGFYSYGEIAPLTPGAPVCIHNETYVILFLGTRN